MTQNKQQLTPMNQKGEDNRATVTGQLVKKELIYGTSKKTNIPFIRGTVTLRVAKDEDVDVNFFQMEYREKDGKRTENTFYKGLLTTLTTQLSIADIAEMSEEDAKDKQPAYLSANGSVDLNEYYNTNTGTVQRRPQINALFISEVKRDAQGNLPKPAATFSFSGIVDRAVPAESAEQASTVHLLHVNFRGSLIPFEVKVYGEQGINFVNSLQLGSGLFVHGTIRNFFKEEVVTTEMTGGFGEAHTEVKRTYINEWTLRGARPLDETKYNYTDTELVRQAKAERETYLSGLKGNAEARVQATTSNNNAGAVLFEENSALQTVDIEDMFG